MFGEYRICEGLGFRGLGFRGLGFRVWVWVWGLGFMYGAVVWFPRSVFRFVFGLLGLRLSRIYVSNYLIKALYIHTYTIYTHIYIYTYIYTYIYIYV